MDPREERFRAKLKEWGEHLVWTGAVDRFGTGLVRIDGRLRTVQRAAWEFARGPPRRPRPRLSGRASLCPHRPPATRAQTATPACQEYAALVDGALVERTLKRLRAEGARNDEIRATYRLLHDTYAWARRRRWTRVDPLRNLTLDDVL